MDRGMFITNFIMLFFIAFLIGVANGSFMIKALRSLNFKQYVREDGPKKHLIKTGVPTMGGVIFLGSWLVALIFVLIAYKGIFDTSSVLFICFSTLAYGFVGMVDDLGKIKKKQNEGLSIKGKFLFIFVASTLLWFFFLKDFSLSLPFTDIRITNPVISIVFISLIYSALTNATNFTDGVDGLLAAVSIPVTALLAAVAFRQGNIILFYLNALFTGALSAYLVFNFYPAKVMMGDLGSLAIGGFILSNSLLLDIYWFIPIFGIWYVIEVVSVMIQIFYFKKTGKRFFKMAPYHHHLELSGFSERKIVFIANLVTAVFCVVSYVLIFLS